MAMHAASQEFPLAVRGYERNVVDARVAALEAELREAKARISALDARLATVLGEHAAQRSGGRDAGVGADRAPRRDSRRDHLLKLAEAQASEVITAAVARSVAEAEAVVAAARAAADRLMAQARSDADRIRAEAQPGQAPHWW